MIVFDHVSKVYPNGTVGLDDVSLRIDDGEFVAIIGRSGAGKSTLLRAVNRMHQITSGTLTVNGTDVTGLSGKRLRQFRRGIGMVFQSFNLVTRTSVIKNVLAACVPDMPFWRVLLGAFRKEDKLKALESLDKVGILDKAYMRADQLSGGQQQRVALARTLTQDPHIILADEPVAALDPVTAKQVMEDFVHINQELGISILLNIHHVELALEYADRVIGIRAGRIVYRRPVEAGRSDGSGCDLRRGRRLGGCRMSLYDRIFRPRRYTLSDGTVVEEKCSRAPLVILILVLLTAVSVRVTGFNFSVLVKKGSKFFDILKAMFPPNTAYLGKIWQPLWDTIKMSFLGSFIGAVLAVPFAIAAASNIVTNRVVVFLVRLFLSLVRTLPTLVCALIATYIFGLGTMAGTCAIAVFTFAYVGKQLFEIIETVDMGPYEALEALGATRLRAFVTAIFPQVLPTYLSVSLFCLEGNVRYASILGYVGAGGLGLIMNEKIGWREYDSLGMILIVLFITVMIIEGVSHALRKRLT